MFNEMYNNNNSIRKPYKRVVKWIDSVSENNLKNKHNEAEKMFKRIGITFSIYKKKFAAERMIPFDMMPRIFTSNEWNTIQSGVMQRAKALNLFLADVYNEGKIIKDKVIPAKLIYGNTAYDHNMIGFMPPGKIFSHVLGIDIVRTSLNKFIVLEDNCRTPSGVSYMIQNREIMMTMFPDLFKENKIEPIDEYPVDLREMLASMAPPKCKKDPIIVVLTPGSLNSAYYEHSFLADLMGVELVESGDLFTENDKVYMRTVTGPEKIDVIYRRLDDEFLDPLCFNQDSLIGVPGIMNSYRTGNVTICSAPGSGIADDKAIYSYVPEIIKFYLSEKPILENVKTWNCSRERDLKYVLSNLKELVVKEVHGSGGYGMLVGPNATKNQIKIFSKKIKNNPSNYIAQPTLPLSTCPTFTSNGIAPRHVDFRPFCLMGKDVKVCKGGLTRVALKENSLIVNSSQGGGVKDTWVLQK